MNHDNSSYSPDLRFATPGKDLGRFREMLRRCVGSIPLAGQAQFDESDIVQQALAEAYAGRDAFRGRSEVEITVWLQRILSRNMLDAARRIRSRKRIVANEVQLHQLPGGVGQQSGIQLPSEQTSPSGKAIQNEELQRMQLAIETLPDGQREAITLHHLQGMTLAEVATHMNRSFPAVAGLLHRGLQAIKNRMGD